jgi:LysR family glycine cleavage system transcriptional activator
VRRLPPLGSIQAFVIVARLGTIKAAADALSLSSPALTRRIQSLEQFVGSPLFDRQPNAIRLNARGNAFLAEAEPHVDALALAVERVSAPRNSMRLRIAVPSLFASQRLMPELPSLRLRHPNLTVEVDTAPNRLSLLYEGADAAIVISEGIDERLYSRLLARGRIAAIGSRQLGVSRPEDLRRVPILLHRQMPEMFNAWRGAVGLTELEPADVIYFDAGQLILDAAAGGMGVAFMLDSHLACSVDSRLVQLLEQTTESPYAYWFACLPGALERRPVRLFHDWLFDHLAEESECRAAAE